MSIAINKNKGVATKHREFIKIKPAYELILDCIEGGEIEIKRKGEVYLPKPGYSNPDSVEAANELKKRYEDYKKRAVFYNVARRTLAGSVGLAFINEPEINITETVLIEDVDGTGTGIIQQIKKAISYNYGCGRSGLFLDYSETNKTSTKEDVKKGLSRPVLELIRPDKIINWRVKNEKGVKRLSLVVIQMDVQVKINDFEDLAITQYKVLKLDDEGNFIVEIWQPSNLKSLIDSNSANLYLDENFELAESITMIDSKGEPLKEITFKFIGCENNDSSVDYPSFYDLCSLNIAHYRNSADFEELMYLSGQATPVISGVTKMWVEEVLKGRIVLGSRAGIPLPEGGTASFLQVEAKGALLEAMKEKENQMKALGARLSDLSSVQKTATEITNEAVSDSSYLVTVVDNVEMAYNAILAKLYLYTGSSATNTIKLVLPEFFNINEDETNVEA